MRIRVAHLYPDYLNIYADRGNIAVFERRAALRGHALEITGVEPGDALEPSAFDLIYVGGGQDREQALIAPDLAARGERDPRQPSTRERRCSRSAVATSCSGAATAAGTDRRCRAPGSSRTRRSRATSA